MSKRNLILMSALCTLVGVSAASAEVGKGGRFAKLDSNGDGALSAQEFEARTLTRFQKADKNQDGKVTAEERSALREGKIQKRFAKRDTNQDGVLQASEVTKMPAQVFSKLDIDKSGGLSAAELQGARKGHDKEGGKLARIDANGDGVVSQDEVLTKARARFAKLDTNRDGKLAKDELKAHWGHGRCDKGENKKG